MISSGGKEKDVGHIYRVEVYDALKGVLNFDLKNVLQVLPEFAGQLQWYILDIEAVGRGLNGESILDTEKRTSTSAHGIQLSFAELQDLASGLEQTINAVIVGVGSKSPAPTLPVAVGYDAPYIGLEAVDSSFWVVTSSDSNVVELIEKHFRDTKR